MGINLITQSNWLLSLLSGIFFVRAVENFSLVFLHHKKVFVQKKRNGAASI